MYVTMAAIAGRPSERTRRGTVMSPNTILPDDLARLRENVIDLDAALADALDAIDPDDRASVARLADLSGQYRAHLAALARRELRAVPR